MVCKGTQQNIFHLCVPLLKLEELPATHDGSLDHEGAVDHDGTFDEEEETGDTIHRVHHKSVPWIQSGKLRANKSRGTAATTEEQKDHAHQGENQALPLPKCGAALPPLHLTATSCFPRHSWKSNQFEPNACDVAVAVVAVVFDEN